MSHVNTVQCKSQNPPSIIIHILQLTIGHSALLTEKYWYLNIIYYKQEDKLTSSLTRMNVFDWFC